MAAVSVSRSLPPLPQLSDPARAEECGAELDPPEARGGRPAQEEVAVHGRSAVA